MDLEIIFAIRARVGVTDLTDEQIWAIYLTAGSINCTAAEIWMRKVGDSGDLIDITEGSSKRNMSQASGQAMKIADYYANLCAIENGGDPEPAGRSAVVRPIERP